MTWNDWLGKYLVYGMSAIACVFLFGFTIAREPQMLIMTEWLSMVFSTWSSGLSNVFALEWQVTLMFLTGIWLGFGLRKGYRIYYKKMRSLRNKAMTTKR